MIGRPPKVRNVGKLSRELLRFELIDSAEQCYAWSHAPFSLRCEIQPNTDAELLGFFVQEDRGSNVLQCHSRTVEDDDFFL
jgi:hypothetical protein